jgi:hypothetical protein
VAEFWAGINMKPERTELEWAYQPTDFFEGPYGHATADFKLTVSEGRVLVTLVTPHDPVPNSIEDDVTALVAGIFHVRQLQSHGSYSLEGPTIYQHSGGRKSVAIRLRGVLAIAASVARGDIIVRDPAGNVVHDSKAERITRQMAELDAAAPTLARTPIGQSMFASYARAVADAENELIHLYEIRETLVHYYGGEAAARAGLGISKVNWRRFGELANVEPLEQGRHRGKHPLGRRRRATKAELDEARNLVKAWIFQFAQTL